MIRVELWQLLARSVFLHKEERYGTNDCESTKVTHEHIV